MAATAAVAIHQFAECITCHAWSPDQSMIAFCPNNNEVHIYKFFTDKWEKLHVLSKVDGPVCSQGIFCTFL
jgi:actin related protein 2/3 complex subunit 1A/1B